MQAIREVLKGSVPHLRRPVSHGLPRFSPPPTEQLTAYRKPPVVATPSSKPLSEPTALSKYTMPLYDSSVAPALKLTTLPNGLRVVTLGGAALLSSAGVFIQSGSRLEDHSNSGVSHLFERMAFKVRARRCCCCYFSFSKGAAEAVAVRRG